MSYLSYDCHTLRTGLDAKFKKTNSSMMNIYNKCYWDDSFSVWNDNCDDESGIFNHMNNDETKINWHIDSTEKWDVCSETIM